MRYRTTCCLVLLLVSVAVVAQESRFQYYAYAAPGATVFGSGGNSTAVFGYGSGIEAFVGKGLTVGGEIGSFVPNNKFGVPTGILSADGTYYFNKSVNRVAPFVAGGYTWAYGCGCRTDPISLTPVCSFPYSNGANFGGGATWWRKRYGLRLEFRDHYFPGTEAMNILSFRIGFAARKR